jgi:DNA mismatch endonuclease (patch repair protein)
MRRIGSSDTSPELLVRKGLHALGYRFQITSKNLPGKPDLVFSRRRKVIFVHGCFWHSHQDCPIAHLPKTRPEYWQNKFEVNMARDQRNAAELNSLGWSVMVVWECETTKMPELLGRLTDFLGPTQYSTLSKKVLCNDY